METKRPKTVLALMPQSGDIASRSLSGIQRVADERGWNFFAVNIALGPDGSLLVMRSPGGATIGELFRFLEPDGVIVGTGYVGPAEIGGAAAPHTPIVRLNREKDIPGRATAIVHGDSTAFAELAAHELLRSGFANFSYAPSSDAYDWSRERGEAFARFVALAGRTFHPFPRRLSSADALRRIEVYAPWLEALPKPVGIFASNDAAAEAVLRLCDRMGLAVPAQVAVCGVDDLATICEYTRPTLSSVRRDLEGEGRAAAELLSEWMERPRRRTPAARAVPPVGLVRRDSTRFAQQRYWRVARAQEWIRLHACEEGVGVPRVVREMGVSRTTADRLFRNAAGRSILAEIQAARIARAKEMLRAGTPPDIAATDCGFASTLDFRRVFRRIAGAPVVAWTKKHH